ncbi:MAG: HAMP domain-containing sensor histidine kinase [Desulfotignum sp.]
MIMALSENECPRPSRIFFRIFPADLKTLSLWLIRLRWAVPPVIAAAVGAAMVSSHQIPRVALLMMAVWILCYNLVLWAWTFRLKPSDRQKQASVQKFIYWQLGLDSLALMALIYITGGILSPLLYFCVFPIMFAAGLLPPIFVYGFTALAVGGLTFMTYGKFYGFLDQGAVFGDTDSLVQSSVPPEGFYLFFFAVILSLTAWLTTTAIGLFFQRTQPPDTRSDIQTDERTRFMMRAAHNLRAPLSAILSVLEVLRGRHLGELNPDQSEYLRRVDRRAHTMLEMINELMHLSTSRSRQLPSAQKPVDTEWLGSRLERTFQNEAADRKIDFTVNVENGLSPLSGNSDQIEQMLENLVSNAIKYTPDGGWVKVAFTGAPGNRVAIGISDSGIGIPEKDQPRLFTEFFRADNARKKQELGTGLGLAIVREIVNAHQGFIQVKSRENQGTTVQVTLPAAQTIGREQD